MRRTLVWIAMLGALGVLAIRLWPRAEVPTIAEADAPPLRVVTLAGDRYSVDEETCAGPALRMLLAHPGWQVTLQEREWDDVADDEPDEVLATVRIDATHATWTDGDLPQTIELDATERVDLIVAAQRSCAPTNPGNGYTGYYVTVSYGPVVHDAIELPSESRAAIDVIAVLEHARARYVANRLSSAQVMTLALAESTHRLTVFSDGRVVDESGYEHDPLAALDLVDALDWALTLPARAAGPHLLHGTLEIAGSKKSIALPLAELRTYRSAWRSPLLQKLMSWERQP